jgi:hypothetical protein
MLDRAYYEVYDRKTGRHSQLKGVLKPQFLP